MTAQAGGASTLASLRDMRRRLRALRCNLPPAERSAAERAIRAGLRRFGLWQACRRVAVYIGMPGEVDLRPSFDDAWRNGVQLYVPRIVHRRSGAMAFVPLAPTAVMRKNSFGIAEPAGGCRGRIPTLWLDAIVVPLVGFDRSGHRLGMGAGFYDRALRRRLDRTQSFRRPLLIGVAYSIQEVEHIEPAPWDVALDFVVTERGVRRFDSRQLEETKPCSTGS